MLRIMLLHDGDMRAVSLRQTLEQAGIEIVAEAPADFDLADTIAAVDPDVVLIDSDAPARDTLENLCVTSAFSAKPVVMFTGDGNRDAMRTALHAGVAAYIVGDVPPSRIASLLNVAMERFAVEQARREELSQMRKKLADRQAIEKAKGLLMQWRDISEGEAYSLLRERAMQRQKRLGDVASEVLEMAQWMKTTG